MKQQSVLSEWNFDQVFKAWYFYDSYDLTYPLSDIAFVIDKYRLCYRQYLLIHILISPCPKQLLSASSLMDTRDFTCAPEDL